VVKADPAHCKCVSAQNAAIAGRRIVLPVGYEHDDHIWNQFTLRVLNGQRDALRDHLQANKIGCDIYYPVTMEPAEVLRPVCRSAHARAARCRTCWRRRC